MKKIIFAVACCLSLALTGCGSQDTVQDKSQSNEEVQVQHSASNGLLTKFNATDLQGNTVNEEILLGHKLTMVNVWATFCNPCIEEMPDLGVLSQEYADKGVQIVGMVSDVMSSDGNIDKEQIALAQEIVDSTGASYTHIIPGEDLYSILYQITSVPTTFFVDESGNQVGKAYLGSRDKESWKVIIDKMLEEVGE